LSRQQHCITSGLFKIRERRVGVLGENESSKGQRIFLLVGNSCTDLGHTAAALLWSVSHAAAAQLHTQLGAHMICRVLLGSGGDCYRGCKLDQQ
jgi:hypothetical protein